MHKVMNKITAPTFTDAQLLRLVYSTWDFQQALSALTFLMEECDFQAKYSKVQLRKFRCYETSIIISFARPFETSRGRTSIGIKAIGVKLDTEELNLKNKLLELRRKVIAHSDEDSMHFTGTLMQPFEDTQTKFPLFNFKETLHLEQGELRPLEELLRKLIHGISTTIFQISQTNPTKLEIYKSPNNL